MENFVVTYVLLLLTVTTPTLSTFSESCALRACHQLDPHKLNIHLIPHSHSELGWLKTDEEYFYGINNNADSGGTQYILDSVFKAIQKNANRRYIQAETAFFWKWWQTLSENQTQLFRSFVDSGKIEMVGGGWSINDEACTNYQSIINQFTLGLRILNDTLGECGRPKIGWQIDTFGHSREMASIFQKMGYEALFISRIGEYERMDRKISKTLEFMWATNDNFEKNNILISIMDDYNSPKNFCWDYLKCSSDAINDDKESIDYNLDKKIKQFESYIATYSSSFQTNNVMIPMGGNMHYQAAEINYMNMDKLIEAFEDHPKYNVFYSTPSCYIQAVKSHKLPYYIKHAGDFFPYNENYHSYWSGYYSSRSTIKKFSRTGHNILQAAQQINAFGKLMNIITSSEAENNLRSLKEAVGTMQHHQAISGTHRETVAKSYVKMLTKAIRETESRVGRILGNMLKLNHSEDVNLPLSTCLLTNISVCDNSMKNRSLIVLYNPLPKTAFYNIRLPVQNAKFTFTGSEGPVNFEILTAIEYPVQYPYNYSGVEFVATVQIPPLGIKVYYLQKIHDTSTAISHKLVEHDKEIILENQNLKLALDTKTRQRTITVSDIIFSIDQNYMYYVSNNGTEDDISSGAYVFRPANNSSAVKVNSDNYKVKYLKGQYNMEIIEYINDYIIQIIRTVVEDDNITRLEYIEIDWLVGPLSNKTVQTNFKLGTELITRYSLKNVNNFIFYTDSNGKQMIERNRNNYRYNADGKSIEPVAANYYPISSRISYTDYEKLLQMSVLTDRPQGGTSLNNGEIELMLLRRTLMDDKKGLEEPLQEMEFGNYIVARGKHFITMGPSNGSRFERILALNKLNEPWVLIADATSDDMSFENLQQKINFEWSGLQINNGKGLPHNINILNFEPWKDETFLLRIEHIFDKDEDKEYSQKTSLELKHLFEPFVITSLRELNLGANEFIDRTIDGPNYIITLLPTEIRTFIISFT